MATPVFSVGAEETPTTDFAGGSGTEADPYLIETKDHLNNVRNDLDAHYKMVADIVFTDEDFAEGGTFYNDGNGWETIIKTSGSYYYSFTGAFDGDNHYIEGLSIYGDSSNLGYIGLFGDVSGEIKNLEMRSTVISLCTSKRADIGCITGAASNATISNCKVQGEISVKTAPYYEGAYVGGICGRVAWSDIVNCVSETNIVSDGAFDYVGGICGGVQEGSISKSVNYSKLAGTYNIGGIAGEIVETGITYCANFGQLHGNVFSKQLGDGSYASYDSEVGGIVAHSNSKDTVKDCFNAGELFADGTYGRAGGITGFSNDLNIDNCYNVGAVSASQKGGVIADPHNVILSNCYYSAPSDGGVNITGSTACSLDEMKSEEVFAGFSFGSVWEFVEGNDYEYPTLIDVGYYIGEELPNEKDWEGYTAVSTKEELNAIRDDLSGKYYLTANIVFDDSDFAEDGIFYNEGMGWLPIGTDSDNPFSGIFDGNGFQIENLQITASKGTLEYFGLFGYSTGEIKNLGLTNSNIQISVEEQNINVGAIAGYTKGRISNCFHQGIIIVTSVSAIDDSIVAGGLIGQADNSNAVIIDNCYNDGIVTINRTVTSTASSGGMAVSLAGGIIGKANSNITVSQCYNLGNIGTTYIGNDLVLISSGGIVGYSYGDNFVIERCYNNGDISATSVDADNLINNYAGGIVGDVRTVKISECYNAGKILSEHESGGIMASDYEGSEISDCFNVASVVSGFSSGGIAGSTNATLSRCYNIGCVEGDILGGIIGFNNGGTAIVTDCFYLDTVSKGGGNWGDVATKCSLDAMKSFDLYSNFDFSAIWGKDEKGSYSFPVIKSVELHYTKELVAIHVDTLPSQLMYLEGRDLLDVSDGKIILMYNDGETQLMNMTNHMIEGFNNANAGKQTLSITYEGKMCEIEVEILAKDLCGNIDNSADGVSAADALLALQAATGKITLNDAQKIVADVDGTAGITAADALMILQFSTQKITSFSVAG